MLQTVNDDNFLHTPHQRMRLRRQFSIFEIWIIVGWSSKHSVQNQIDVMFYLWLNNHNNWRRHHGRPKVYRIKAKTKESVWGNKNFLKNGKKCRGSWSSKVMKEIEISQRMERRAEGPDPQRQWREQTFSKEWKEVQKVIPKGYGEGNLGVSAWQMFSANGWEHLVRMRGTSSWEKRRLDTKAIRF